MPKKRSGSVLAISLVILTAITLISISSLQRSGLQTKIVANIQHQEQLFNIIVFRFKIDAPAEFQKNNNKKELLEKINKKNQKLKFKLENLNKMEENEMKRILYWLNKNKNNYCETIQKFLQKEKLIFDV